MADRQNRVGSKIGGAGVAGASESNVDRRERLRKLALETIGKTMKQFYWHRYFVISSLANGSNAETDKLTQ